jgi:hypothetical protein
VAEIVDPSAGAEGGALYLGTVASGVMDSDAVVIKEGLVGLNTDSPATRLDLSDGAMTIKIVDEEPDDPANDCIVIYATASGVRGVDREIKLMAKADDGEKAIILSTVV